MAVKEVVSLVRSDHRNYSWEKGPLDDQHGPLEGSWSHAIEVHSDGSEDKYRSHYRQHPMEHRATKCCFFDRATPEGGLRTESGQCLFFFHNHVVGTAVMDELDALSSSDLYCLNFGWLAKKLEHNVRAWRHKCTQFWGVLRRFSGCLWQRSKKSCCAPGNDRDSKKRDCANIQGGSSCSDTCSGDRG